MIRIRPSRPLRTSSRRATVIVFVMIALLVATLLSAELVKVAGMSHRLLKRDEWLVQANRLADAGCARAIALIERDAATSLDDWKISSSQLPGRQAAIIRIKITTSEADERERIISVISEYPSDHPDVVRATRELRIPR